MNHEITLEVAEVMLQVGKSKSKELKILEDIAVVDASGNLKAFVRMDGAWLGSIDIAIRKARTARYFDMETAEIGRRAALRRRTQQWRSDHFWRRNTHQRCGWNGDWRYRRQRQHCRKRRHNRQSCSEAGNGRKFATA
jgi:hypothetical protein